MSFIFYNPNPSGKRTGDCVIRAIAKATGQDWERAYTNLCVEGYTLYDLPSSNRVWGSYLQSRNFEKIQLFYTDKVQVSSPYEVRLIILQVILQDIGYSLERI